MLSFMGFVESSWGYACYGADAVTEQGNQYNI